jgi:hypothetical protein
MAACCLPLAACAAAPTIVPNQPREVIGHPLPPYQSHEECVSLVRGDVLEWRFEARAPLAFDIRYYEGNAVILPVVRDKAARDEGVFEPLVAQDYCLMWEAGARGTPLDYHVLVRRKP